MGAARHLRCLDPGRFLFQVRRTESPEEGRGGRVGGGGGAVCRPGFLEPCVGRNRERLSVSFGVTRASVQIPAPCSQLCSPGHVTNTLSLSFSFCDTDVGASFLYSTPCCRPEPCGPDLQSPGLALSRGRYQRFGWKLGGQGDIAEAPWSSPLPRVPGRVQSPPHPDPQALHSPACLSGVID